MPLGIVFKVQMHELVMHVNKNRLQTPNDGENLLMEYIKQVTVNATKILTFKIQINIKNRMTTYLEDP